jgi:polar amino acid transport system substrate-binding protein
MKALSILLITLCSLVTHPVFSQDEPLRVVVTRFSPPFVLNGKNQLFGFDISMMLSICKLINRTCQFNPVPFHQLFPMLNNNQADVAVGNISITLERMKVVDFTPPYLPGVARFIGLSQHAQSSVTPAALANKKIGVFKGSMLINTLLGMGIDHPIIRQYGTDDNIISALANKEIDFAIMEEETAKYWRGVMPNVLSILGKQIPYPYGLAIAVGKGNKALLDVLNQALLTYQNSQAFKNNYNTYLVY